MVPWFKVRRCAHIRLNLVHELAGSHLDRGHVITEFGTGYLVCIIRVAVHCVLIGIKGLFAPASHRLNRG
jgi:hypothetical protein